MRDFEESIEIYSPFFKGVIILSCPNYRKLCRRLIISQSVTFTDDTLVINIPAGNYNNREKYCIVVAQNIPDETTITAPVVITIGDDTETTYPLLNCDCTNVTACSINRRTRYSVCVFTDISTGVFKLLGKIPCSRCADFIDSLPVPVTAAPAEVAPAAAAQTFRTVRGGVEE